MKVNNEYTTQSYSVGVNQGKYIMLHHTGPGNGIDIVKYLAYSGVVSCHFVVDRDGTIYQLATIDKITRHAGVSYYDGLTNLNNHSVGIEVVSDGHTFTQESKIATRELCENLIYNMGITGKEIIRHLDVAGRNAPENYNRGKWDIGDNFWDEEFDSWVLYQMSYDKLGGKNWTKEQRRQLESLKKVNSFFWNKYNDPRLRDSLHQTNEILRSIL